MTDAEIIKAFEYCVSVKNCNDCKKSTPRICTTFETKDFLDLINRQKAEITALQMENGLLQSNVSLAIQNYEHIKEKWCESREVIYRQTDRFLNTYKELQLSKKEIERLQSILLKFAREINHIANNTDISAVGYQSIIAEINNLVKEMAGEC